MCIGRLSYAIGFTSPCSGGELKWAVVPLRILRFCRNCLIAQQTVSGQLCGICGGELLPFLDGRGAIAREFLLARGSCCSSGCRNCPYERTQSVSDQAIPSTTEKICPRCAATFQCRSGGCWCSDVCLGPIKIEWLKQHYENCLCPACLASIESSAPEALEALLGSKRTLPSA